MLLEHERYYRLGMDALVTVRSWNTTVIMVWACMLLEHERYYGLGMDMRWSTHAHVAAKSFNPQKH